MSEVIQRPIEVAIVDLFAASLRPGAGKSGIVFLALLNESNAAWRRFLAR
jgi:hypothetical protein